MTYSSIFAKKIKFKKIWAVKGGQVAPDLVYRLFLHAYLVEFNFYGEKLKYAERGLN